MKRSDRPTELDIHVLIAIMQLKRAYGVSIQEFLEERAEWNASMAAIYLSLERLSERKFVTSELGEATQERGGRAKRFYEISPSGRQAVRNSIQSVNRMIDGLPFGLGVTR